MRHGRRCIPQQRAATRSCGQFRCTPGPPARTAIRRCACIRLTRHATATSQRITFPSNWSTNGPDWAHDAQNHAYVDEVEVFYDGDLGTPTTGTMFDNTIAPVP